VKVKFDENKLIPYLGKNKNLSKSATSKIILTKNGEISFLKNQQNRAILSLEIIFFTNYVLKLKNLCS
jgi:hypothetical protein